MYKILIVDDEAIIRRGLKNIIDWQSLECTVCDEAGNGLEAIDKVKVNMPDIIIVDIKMPGMNGIELIKEVKNIVKQCKIIILSGYRDFEYMQSAIKLGAFDYILKPSKVNDIVEVVKRAVAKIKEEKKEIKESKIISLSIRKTLDYINEHYSENITLNYMAEYNGISSYYLSRLFTKETGKNFVDYVNEVRIKRAKELLREDNYKYYEIAEMVGINDSHYFSKIFKKYTGVTPSEYKREKC